MSLFANFTWSSDNLNANEMEVLKHWTTPHSGVFVSLTGFMISTVSLNVTIEDMIFSFKCKKTSIFLVFLDNYGLHYTSASRSVHSSF